jgi:eukaryotic-like serine/threonine-protein kinase
VAKLLGATELRRAMVERSLAYLDSLAGDAADDVGLQKELAGAYVRLGDVAGRQDIANVGDPQTAATSYGKAEALLRHVIAADPGDRDSRRRLATLLEVLRMVEAGVQPQERERTLKRLAEATVLWEQLAREDPKDRKSLYGLASTQLAAFTLQARSDPDGALPHVERALQILQGLLQADPNDLEYQRDAAQCYRLMSSFFQRRDPARGLEMASQASRIDLERVAAEPQNSASRLDLSRDYQVLGDIHLAQGRHPEALRSYGQALPLRRELWDADHANTLAWNQLAFLLMRIGETHVLAGEHRLAAPFLRESLELTATRPDQRQHWVLGTLARTYFLQGEVDFAAGRDPCPSYRRMKELTAELPEAQAYFSPETVALRDRAGPRLKSCGV